MHGAKPLLIFLFVIFPEMIVKDMLRDWVLIMLKRGVKGAIGKKLIVMMVTHF